MGERVLVVGSGAREHALVWALAQSPSVGELWAAPGNPGIAEIAQMVNIPATDISAIADWAEANEIGFVVVGPEAPLAEGLSDLLQQHGITVFGPTRAAAELEWSKRFAKEFMRRHGIPAASSETFSDLGAALAFVQAAAYPLVVKADGLAAGKGVVICASPEEADSALRSMLAGRAFGRAGETVIIEEHLEGDELSVIALVDGERCVLLPSARDYKRLREGDIGLNTGGMGSYAPVMDLPPGFLTMVHDTVLQPAIDGLRHEGRLYRGALYAGLMLTRDGPKVLEFNCRCGDPETQATLPLLSGDVAALLRSCAEGRLDADAITVKPGAAVCVVLAAAGYPEHPRSGDVIKGIHEACAGGALVFHAGTALRGGELVTNGGRVLSVVALGEDVAEAADRAYAAADRIDFAGKQMRRDVAATAVPQRA